MSSMLSAAAEPLDGLAGWAVGLMRALGGAGAALVVALDNLFPPIPSELVLPLAGFSAAQGVFSLPAALFWTTLGSVAGALVVYAVGALLGRDRTRRLVLRLPLLKASDFDRSERWFARHGAKAVLLGRVVPLVRSFISLPAGIERMNPLTFVVLTTIGSLCWNSIFVVTGYALGSSWYLVDAYAGVAQKVVVVALVGAVAAFAVTRLRARGRSSGDVDPANPGTSGAEHRT